MTQTHQKRHLLKRRGLKQPLPTAVLAAVLLLGLPTLGSLAPTRSCAAEGILAQAPAFPWVTNYQQGIAQARREGKDVVLFFTGSDWCGHCMTLEREVFQVPSFAQLGPKHYVFVRLDFPESPALQARIPDREMRDRLRKDYGVRGFPTLWLTTPEGLPYASASYAGDGPEAFLLSLQGHRPKRDRLMPLLRAGRRADAAMLRAALPHLTEEGLLKLPHYAWVLQQLRAVDPQGRLGLRQHADRIQELNEMMALFEGAADWDRIHRFLLSARFITNEQKYANGLALCAEHHLLAAARYSEALDLVRRAQQTPSLRDNTWAQADFRALKERIEAARASAGALPR